MKVIKLNIAETIFLGKNKHMFWQRIFFWFMNLYVKILKQVLQWIHLKEAYTASVISGSLCGHPLPLPQGMG